MPMPTPAFLDQKKIEIAENIIVGVGNEKRLPQALKQFEKKLSSVVEEFDAEQGNTYEVNLYEEKIKRIVLVGLGKETEYELKDTEKVIGKTVKKLVEEGCKSIGVAVLSFRPDHVDLASVVRSIAEIVDLASYKFIKYKTKDAHKIKSLKKAYLIVNSKDLTTRVKQSLKDAEVVADAVKKCRDIINEPPNVANGEFIVNHAKRVLKGLPVTIKVMEEDELRKKKMGGVLAVGGGSANRPKFLVMRYSGSKGKKKILSLVGKGVTFDSGGLNIKPGGSINTMKSDMSGAACVIHTLYAIARLKVRKNVVGITPLVENMPSGEAYRPDDVVTTFSGLTVEVTNTDAEGRMILCDALAYTNSVHKPQGIVDVATLTGAAVVALGYGGSPFMSTDEKLSSVMKHASEKTNELVWELPFWEYFDGLIKSEIADVKHLSEDHQAGTIIGGAFLKNFVGNTPYLHLDIAGTAFTKKPTNIGPYGATGFGVRLLTEFVKMWE